MAFVEAAVVILLFVGAVAGGISLAWRMTRELRLASSKRTVNAATVRQQVTRSFLLELAALPIFVLATVTSHLPVIFLAAYLAVLTWGAITVVALARRRR